MATTTDILEHVDLSFSRYGPVSGDSNDRQAVVNLHPKASPSIGVEGWYQVGAEFENGPSPRSISAAGDQAGFHRLTRRERQDLRLVAMGCTDREVGDLLFIGARTAEWHLANAFNKLGLSSRAAAAAYAVRHGLA